MVTRLARIAVLALVLALSPAPALAAWRHPVGGRVTRPFALSPDRFAAGQHRGIDLASPPGAAVRAACGGRVHFAGRVPGGGRTLSVRCGRFLATYQHLAAITVGRGDAVFAGERVARAGGELHLGARVAATGDYVDPRTLFGAPPRDLPPLGRAPRGRLPRRVPPRPAPAPAPVTAPAPAPVLAPAPQALRSPEPDGRAVPWPVWLGVAALAPAIGAGGLVRRRSGRRSALRRREAAHGHR